MTDLKENKSKTLIVLRGMVFITFITITLASVVFQENFFVELRPTSFILLPLAVISTIKSNQRSVLK